MRWGLALGAAAVVAVVLLVGFFGEMLLLSPSPGGTTTRSTGTCYPGQEASGPGWTTYHADNNRSGAAGGEFDSCARPGWVSPALDGAVYAEPLASGGMFFVATENDSVYALHSLDGSVAWRAHLGVPMKGSALPCGDIDPSGITSTPVIDTATGTIYVVAFVQPGNHILAALSMGDGSVKFSLPADPPGANPLVEQQRAALTLANGRVYIPYGGLAGDCGAYHGWVVGLNENGLPGVSSYMVPTNREGGLWAPSGAVVDASGNIFVTTGNGDSTSTFDHGNSVIELSPDLQELGYFAPSNWAQLNGGDTDLGSTGPLLVGHGLVFQIGKEGVGYLLNESSLGGIGGQVYSQKVCSGVFGGLAALGNLIFLPCSDGVTALQLTGNSFSILWRSSDFASGPPIVTRSVIWAMDPSNGTLLGFDASTGTSLYAFHMAQSNRFTTPSSAYGMVVVAAGDRVYSYLIGQALI